MNSSAVNLEDWGHVLDHLEEWTRTGQLSAHQDDLLWLLRYGGNWRLREAALEAMASMRNPASELIDEACRIMMDDNLYHQVRVLAAEAVAAAGGGDKLGSGEQTGLNRKVRDQMRALLDSHQPPIIHRALQRVLPQIQ